MRDPGASQGMSARLASILAVLVLLLGAVALALHRRQEAEKPSDAASLGQPLVKNLQAADIAAIAVRDAKGSITVVRKDDGWVVAERGDFPADLSKVKSFVVGVIGLKIGQVERIGDGDRARLELSEPGQAEGAATSVEFRDAGGKTLARLLVGKKYFRQEPDDPKTAFADGRFVMLPGEPHTAYVVADPLAQAVSRSADWIDTRGFAVERVRSLEYRPAEGEGWKIQRPAETGPWQLDGAKGGEKIDQSKANGIASALSQASVADIATSDLTPANTGLDRPAMLTATTFDGLDYTVSIGKSIDQNYYAQVAIAGELVKSRTPEAGEKPEEAAKKDKAFADRAKTLQERLPREKALAGRVLLLPKYTVEGAMKPRADLFETSSAGKK
jgi:hypothetical protein